MNFKYLFLLFSLLLISCDNPITTTPEETNCIVDKGGFFDNCGICSGGTSGHVANSDKDCSGYIVQVDDSNILEGELEI